MTATRTMSVDQLVLRSKIRMATSTRADDVAGTTVPRQITGRAVPYNTPTNLGWFYEAVMPGAFTKSISEAAMRLPLLLWHDGANWPIGAAATDNGWTEDADGLNGLWDLDDSADANRAADMAERGMLSGLSIGFVPVREWEADPTTLDALGLPEDAICFMVQEGRLVEVSIVPTPAYQDAVVTSVRSAATSRRMAAVGSAPVAPPARRAARTDAPLLAQAEKIRASLHRSQG